MNRQSVVVVVVIVVVPVWMPLKCEAYSFLFVQSNHTIDDMQNNISKYKVYNPKYPSYMKYQTPIRAYYKLIGYITTYILISCVTLYLTKYDDYHDISMTPNRI